LDFGRQRFRKSGVIDNIERILSCCNKNYLVYIASEAVALSKEECKSFFSILVVKLMGCCWAAAGGADISVEDLITSG